MKTFKQFIAEVNQKPHDEVMKTMGRNWERNNPGSNFNVQYRHSDDPNKRHLYVGLINIKKGQRGGRKGSRFVSGITRYADQHNLPVSVKPVAEKGFKRKLKKWYGSHGFEDNKTDIAPHPMIRHPKKSK